MAVTSTGAAKQRPWKRHTSQRHDEGKGPASTRRQRRWIRSLWLTPPPPPPPPPQFPGTANPTLCSHSPPHPPLHRPCKNATNVWLSLGEEDKTPYIYTDLWTRPHTYSEHRFPAPSSKLCQIWLRHWRGTFYLRAAVQRRGQRPPKGSGTDIGKTVEATWRPSTHENVRRIHPGWEEKKKKFRLNSNDFGFIWAGVSNMVSYKTNVWYNFSTNKKLLVSRQFSGPYGVTKYGSGWRKDVVNQCLEFGPHIQSCEQNPTHKSDKTISTTELRTTPQSHTCGHDLN